MGRFSGSTRAVGADLSVEWAPLSKMNLILPSECMSESTIACGGEGGDGCDATS